MNEAKSCPFCGGEAVFSRVPGQGFSLLCQGCGAIAMLRGSQSKAALAAAWNRRTARFSSGGVKPCPFCGSNAALAKMPGDDSILCCQNCGMMISFVRSKTAAQSLSAWSRRV